MPKLDKIKKLITNHERRLQILREQEALHGISVDPKIPLEIEDIEAKITELKTELQSLVEKQNSTPEDDREDSPNKANYYFSLGFAAFTRGDFGEARRFFSMVLDIDPHYSRATELLEEADSFYQKKEVVSYQTFLLNKLRDPIWQGIGGIIAILALSWSVYTFILLTPDPTPTSVPVTDTPTEMATFTEEPTVTATNIPIPSSTPSDITTPSVLPTYSGNLAIPLISGFDSKVYLTGFDGQGINGPNPVSVDAQQPMFSWDGRSILVKATIVGKSGIHKLTSSGFNPELSIERPSAAWPVLSPDGQTVMFSETTLDFRLHIKKPDETIEEVPLNNLFISAKNLLWSDDNQLVFQGCATWLNELDNCGIWITNANDLAPQRVVDNKEAFPMSARAGWLAYISQEDGDWEVYILSLEGGPAVQLTNNDFEDGLPVISPNGDGLAYISKESGAWALWTMNLDGQNKERRFDIDPGRGTIDINQWRNERMSWRR